MADSSSSSIDSPKINSEQSVPMCDIEKLSPNEKTDSKPVTNRKMTFKRKVIPEQHRTLTSKLLNMKQIIHEEYLVREQINRIRLEKQYIQTLLNTLHALHSYDNMQN
ncbi:unnamed protein product [Rotaria socialis]|uniref:Uncharacterized protein n=1 Tax=Rotaria socialis TaxID=392032 RepID=A0A820X9Z6_9BILA|nr:unnamed protein product [Rotaria socialis]CAF3362989.1 unnamed protein product [Rotaria socialis]CAF3509243.1 unnamed protein product [Rotaria socialis]CAF4478427.1 unnamed protein product [Rotaria socialis]CAF4528909.1 unnamed protein product [Rotaria socialis]